MPISLQYQSGNTTNNSKGDDDIAGGESKGNTLIELVIVLGMIMIFVLAMTVHYNLDRYQLRTESQTLAWEIRQLRIQNMAEGPVYSMVLEKNCYRVKRGTKQLKKVILNPKFQIAENLNDNIGANSTLTFSYKGTPNLSGTITIYNIKNREYIEITIVPASGRVQLYDEIHSP